MGILSYVIAKGVKTAAKNATIKATAAAVVTVAGGIATATVAAQKNKEDVIVKDGVKFVRPTRASEEYLGANALDVVQELLGVGFEKVTLRPKAKLGAWSWKKYGQIESISINGNRSFRGVKRVPATAHIVVEYLEFKDTVDQEAYKKVEKINPCVVTAE